MTRIRQALTALRQNRRRGISLIVALCAAALLLGLSLSLIYSASLPLARVSRRLERERCYQLAKSFAEVLDAELLKYKAEQTGLRDLNDATDVPQVDKTFYAYANRVLDGLYSKLDEGNIDATTYTFTAADNTDPNYGKIKVRLIKRDAEDEADIIMGGGFAIDATDVTSLINTAFTQKFTRYLFTVEVTAELEHDSYTYITEYERMDGFVPHFTWTAAGGIGNGGVLLPQEVIPAVYWDGSKWTLDNITEAKRRMLYQQVPKYVEGNPQFDATGNPVYETGKPVYEWIPYKEEDVYITYTYTTSPELLRDNPDEITYKIYRQTMAEEEVTTAP